MKRLLVFIAITSLLVLGTIFYAKKYRVNSVFQNIPQLQQAAVVQALNQTDETVADLPRLPSGEIALLSEPIDEFYPRITKKPFGIYITPQTSPVQPDKFAGYHTGVDIEYGDVAGDVPVRAIADGQIILSKFASGYGGVIVIHHEINGQKILALYGHLDPKSMLIAGTQVTQVQKIGVLGEEYSEETDGARKHLHFAILKKDELDIRGYVKTREELEAWYDPLKFYANHPSPLLRKEGNN